MSSTEQIMDTVKKRRADAANRAAPQNRKRRAAATDPGGLHAMQRDTAVNNESARQVDDTTSLDRDNFPSTWRRSTALDAPPPRQGHIQRWVRIKSNGQDDSENHARYLEEGWRDRKPSSVPKSHSLATRRSQGNAQQIVKRGHILMELPQALADQRNAHYRGALDRQTKAVENELFKDNQGAAGRVMPVTDATVKSRAVLARRRPRAAAADEE